MIKLWVSTEDIEMLQILLGGMGFSRILIHVIVSLSFTQCSIMSHARTFHSSYCPDREMAKDAGQVDFFIFVMHVSYFYHTLI